MQVMVPLEERRNMRRDALPVGLFCTGTKVPDSFRPRESDNRRSNRCVAEAGPGPFLAIFKNRSITTWCAVIRLPLMSLCAELVSRKERSHYRGVPCPAAMCRRDAARVEVRGDGREGKSLSPTTNDLGDQ